MAAAIFVAGMRGVGKSTLLTTYADRAIGLEAEAIQSEAVRIAKGRDFGSPYDWDVWDEDLRGRARTLLREALHNKHSDLQPSDRPLLVVGALLQQEWFREALVDVLEPYFKAQMQNQSLFLLHLDAETISRQIKARGRVHERCFIGNIPKIEKERDGYFSGARGWTKVTSHEELAFLIERRI
jgi:hypothetical protein